MNNRIRSIRELQKEDGKKMSQEKFAQILGVSRSNLANIELGRVEPTELFLKHLCAVFGVSETWLRTGEGEPFEKLSRDEELSAFLGKVASGKDDFRRRFIASLSVLDIEDWEVLEKIASKLLEETKKTAP